MLLPVLRMVCDSDVVFIFKNSSIIDFVKGQCPNISNSQLFTKKSFVTFFVYNVFLRGCFFKIYLPLAKNNNFLRSFFSKTGLFNFKRMDLWGDGHQVDYLIRYFTYNGIVERISDDGFWKTVSNKKGCSIYMGLSCGLAERHKTPSPAYVNNLIHLIKGLDPGIKFVFCLVSSEIAYFERVIKGLSKSDYSVVFDRSIDDTVDTIATCKLAVVGTNGHGHLASLTDTPLIILSGVADALKTGPYGKHLILDHNLPCKHCYEYGYTAGCNSPRCMDTFNLNYVSENVLKLYSL